LRGPDANLQALARRCGWFLGNDLVLFAKCTAVQDSVSRFRHSSHGTCAENRAPSGFAAGWKNCDAIV
jgi:hypothetical protein